MNFLRYHAKELKTIFLVLVALQLFYLVVLRWWVWNFLSPNVFSLRKPKIFPPRMYLYNTQTIDTGNGEGRDRESAIFKFREHEVRITYHVYKSTGTINKATLLFGTCKKVENATNTIELITGFIDLVRNEEYRQSIGELAEDNILNKKVIAVRQMEVLDVLQENLLLPIVGRIHVLVWNKEAAAYILTLPLRHSEKLILQVMGKDVGLKEQLLYASQCLTDRIIAITNQDNKLGKGWDNTEYHRILKENDIMYALTRHSPIKTNCTWLRYLGTCDDGVKHIGSHDTFVLRAKRWNEDVFNELNSITPDKQGMENLFIWFFQNRLKYRILNPCKTLIVHHHHCIPIRGANRS